MSLVVFHFGETDTGRCFYAMELIEGETVEAYVCRNRLIPPYLALEVAVQVARALIACRSAWAGGIGTSSPAI